MIDSLPPASILILGALLVPLVRGRALAAYVVALPLASLAHQLWLFSLPHGAHLQVQLFDYTLTLARVGERAGYSRGLVTHHFGSKQGLVEHLARSAQSGFVPGLGDLPPGLDRLLRLIDGYIAALGSMNLRNKVIHENASVSKLQAAKAIDLVDQLAARYTPLIAP